MGRVYTTDSQLKPLQTAPQTFAECTQTAGLLMQSFGEDKHRLTYTKLLATTLTTT
jgi:hypothetical protein